MALSQHPEFPEIPNLHVMKLMQSMKSSGHVAEVFAWQHYYWKLTDGGVEWLRDHLHLPATIVPSTHKKAATEPARLPIGFGGARSREAGSRPGGDREGYRGKREGGMRSERPQF